MNLTDEEITRAFFEMILRKKEFTEDEEENFAYLWEESLNEEFNEYLDEIGYWEPNPAIEAYHEYWTKGF